MKFRASSLMIGFLALAAMGGAFGAFLAYQKFAGTRQQVPFRVIFEGSASGLRKGGSVNFAGIRVGQVISLKLDNPRRVVALAMIDASTPVRKDTQVGLEFRGSPVSQPYRSPADRSMRPRLHWTMTAFLC